MFDWSVSLLCVLHVCLLRYANDRRERRGSGSGSYSCRISGRRPGTDIYPRQATFLLMSFDLLFSIRMLNYFWKMHVLKTVLYLWRAWQPQAGQLLSYSCLEIPVDNLLPLLWCMMVDIMLVDKPSVVYIKARPFVGTLFGKMKVVFIKTKEFMKTLRRMYPTRESFTKWRCSGGEKVYVFGKQMVLVKTTHGSL